MLSTAVNMLYLMGVYLNAIHVFFVLKEIKNNVLKNFKNNASF